MANIGLFKSVLYAIQFIEFDWIIIMNWIESNCTGYKNINSF